MPESSANPILNGPYDQPDQYFEIGPQGPTGDIKSGRRPSESYIPHQQAHRRPMGPQQAQAAVANQSWDYRLGPASGRTSSTVRAHSYSHPVRCALLPARLRDRLNKEAELIADAAQRGWDREVEQHQATQWRVGATEECSPWGANSCQKDVDPS